MKQKYESINLSEPTYNIIRAADQILEEFMADGLVLTLRQLYYQFIAHDLFPSDWIDVEYNRKNRLPADTKNTDKNYKRLGDIIGKGRLCGLIDWDAIEDRGRVPDIPQEFGDVNDLVDTACKAFRLPRWEGQENYVELWVEKQAMEGVLQPKASQWHVPLVVNKGYSSLSAMREAAKRFRVAGDGRDAWLLYIGDHDPSGEDMVRDIADRLYLFDADVNVQKIALTWEQIQEFNPPPNPAKITDSRAEAYIRKFGDKSWELDALSPRQLHAVIDRWMKKLVDVKRMQAIIDAEQPLRDKLTRAAARIAKGK